MFTNREEVLEKALQVFAKMNYEKATQMEIAKACGLSKAGLVYYFPFKQDLFVAVVDKYVFHTQQLENKFQFTAGSFPEFIDQYIAGVERTMNNLGRLLDNSNPYGCSFNFYYYHLLMQVRLYYGNPPSKGQKRMGKSGRTWMWKKPLRCSGKYFSVSPLNILSFKD